MKNPLLKFGNGKVSVSPIFDNGSQSDFTIQFTNTSVSVSAFDWSKDKYKRSDLLKDRESLISFWEDLFTEQKEQ